MKRIATNNDKNNLKKIYNICFPNEENYCDRFFNTVWDCKNTLVYEINNEVVSMLQMLPITLTNQKEEYSCYYIYAAATLPQFEGKGIMSELLNFSFEINANKDFAILIAQNSSLFNFYEKFGFKKNFTVNKQTIYAKNNNINLELTEDYSLICNIANKNLSNIFHNKRTEQELQNNIICSESEIYIYKNSYCIFEQSGNFSRITEAIGPEVLQLSEQVLYNKNIPFCKATLPFGNTPFGMVKPLKQGYNISGYLNILYN